MKWILILLFPVIYSCSSSDKKEADNTAPVNKTDTMEIIRGFIYGLWSMDSGNILINEGYYFKPDGKVDFVAADASGDWELISKDSIKIVYSNFRQEMKFVSKIDSISEDRMVLTDVDGHYVFRKVPFGMNNEGIVQEGFAGRLEPGSEKEYMINIPSSKKIELKLKSENDSVHFTIYDGTNLMTPTPLRDWTAIMIRSGKYRVVVSNPKNSASKGEAEFDLKFLVY